MMRVPGMRLPSPREESPKIAELTLRNFKAFGNSVETAPMSRITLLYGPNSGGKSTVIQAIMLLKQSEGNLPRGAVLAPQGEYVDLAGFKAMIHRHNEQQQFEIGINLVDQRVTTKTRLVFGKDSLHYTDLPMLHEVEYVMHRNGMIEFSVQFEVDSSRQPTNDEVTNFTWKSPESSIDSYSKYLTRHLLEMSKRLMYRGTVRDSLLIRNQLHGLMEFMDERKELSQEMVEVIRTINLHARSSILPAIVGEDESNEALEHPEVIGLRTYIHQRPFLVGVDSVVFGFRAFCERVSYLGPILDDPRRFYFSLGGRRSTVGKRGEYTFDMLSHDERVRNRINVWFKNFGIPYQIRDLRGVVANELTGTLSTMALEDTRTNTIVTPVDVGFGISQLLPVIVEGIAGSSPIICVDQPEVHLHPRLQAQIADLMIECKEKQWIVETHSELLLRRILRRVAEGRLPVSDVSVLYVDPPNETNSREGSSISVIEIQENGRLSGATPWPEGFFEDGYHEMMATLNSGF